MTFSRLPRLCAPPMVPSSASLVVTLASPAEDVAPSSPTDPTASGPPAEAGETFCQSSIGSWLSGNSWVSIGSIALMRTVQSVSPLMYGRDEEISRLSRLFQQSIQIGTTIYFTLSVR